MAYFGAELLLRDTSTGSCYRQPVSNAVFHPSPRYTGKLQLFPQGCARQDAAALKLLPAVQIGKRAVLVAGTASPMFIVDVVLLTTAALQHLFKVACKLADLQRKDSWAKVLFYVDIVTDIQQVWLFVQEGQPDYLAINLLGITMGLLVMLKELWAWLWKPSSEKEWLQEQLPGRAWLWKPSSEKEWLQEQPPEKAWLWKPSSEKEWLQEQLPGRLSFAAVLMACAALQLHVLIFAVQSLVWKRKHSLLRSAKGAEVTEAAVSFTVQLNFLCLVLGQVEGFHLDESAMSSLGFSLAVSCFSLGLGFASRDKRDATVLEVPGKLDWSSAFAALVLVRTCEVAARLGAYNLLHVSFRHVFIASGAIPVLFVLAAARYLFPAAELADVFAAVAAHPGQVLQERSMLSLARSLSLHSFMCLLALTSQIVAHASPESAAAVPLPALLAWAGAAVLSSLGLWAFHSRAARFDAPFFAELAGADAKSLQACLTHSKVTTVCQNPAPGRALWFALSGHFTLRLDARDFQTWDKHAELWNRAKEALEASDISILVDAAAILKSGLDSDAVLRILAGLSGVREAGSNTTTCAA